MSPEEGLDGTWYSGAIRELRHGWALVAYDELKESEAEDSPPLLEWYPLPGQAQGPAPEARPPGEVHAPASGPQLRPVPPPEASADTPCPAWLVLWQLRVRALHF